MKTLLARFLAISVTVLILLLSSTTIKAEEGTASGIVKTSPEVIEKRTIVLKAFLDKYNSPMKDNATDFVEAANEYNLDWKLVASIAGVESTFGKFVPGNSTNNSYNAWGWGVYGDQAIYFKSWKDGIYTVSKGLRENYYNKGLTDPYDINRIYAASPTWGTKVHWFLTQLDQFQSQYEAKNPLSLNTVSVKTQTAASSAKVTK